MSALEKLKKQNLAGVMRTVLDKTEKMSLFDSMKANTAGTSGLGTIKMDEGSMIFTGRNVGAGQNGDHVRDCRRSIMDKNQKYVGRDDGGSIVPTEEDCLSFLNVMDCCVGVRPFKYDITSTLEHYADRSGH